MPRQSRFSGHGSMTKAGKVRDRTPYVERRGVNSKPKLIPRLRYKALYQKRFIKERYGGQPDSIGAKQFENTKKRKKRNTQK